MADKQQAITGTTQLELGAVDGKTHLSLSVLELYMDIGQFDFAGSTLFLKRMMKRVPLKSIGAGHRYMCTNSG